MADTLEPQAETTIVEKEKVVTIKEPKVKEPKVKEPKVKVTSLDNFVNPFEQGVTYEQFLKAIPEWVSIKDYLKDSELTEQDIAWIEEEIVCYNKNNQTTN